MGRNQTYMVRKVLIEMIQSGGNEQFSVPSSNLMVKIMNWQKFETEDQHWAK